MNIKPEDKTIKDILLSRRQFVIPRFQREYSWDKKNYQEFWEDIISGIEVNNEGKITNNQYFLGTMLFIGNYTDGKDSEIQVVDGQQRLTTITLISSTEPLSRACCTKLLKASSENTPEAIKSSTTSSSR